MHVLYECLYILIISVSMSRVYAREFKERYIYLIIYMIIYINNDISYMCVYIYIMYVSIFLSYLYCIHT